MICLVAHSEMCFSGRGEGNELQCCFNAFDLWWDVKCYAVSKVL